MCVCTCVTHTHMSTMDARRVHYFCLYLPCWGRESFFIFYLYSDKNCFYLNKNYWNHWNSCWCIFSHLIWTYQQLFGCHIHIIIFTMSLFTSCLSFGLDISTTHFVKAMPLSNAVQLNPVSLICFLEVLCRGASMKPKNIKYSFLPFSFGFFFSKENTEQGIYRADMSVVAENKKCNLISVGL